MISVYENIIPSINFKNIYSELKNTPGWSLIGFSSFVSPTDEKLWYLDLSNNELFTKQIFRKICKVTEKKFKILRCYANGQTSDQSGRFHVDSREDDDYTFLYYVNTEWNVLYGGATVFCNDADHKVNNKDFGDTRNFTHTTFYPKPNTGILFSSNIYHVGLGPTKEFKGLRITVAYKLKEMRD